ncbi:uncharacterized protein [Aphelocoma coerulescens]|uniref:uncharacterized protein n=1 Tax=Aphelocoma coerulescens TaxID=39617 RepID=UPI003604DEB5
MGRPPSSDNDNLHRRQGRRDQQLDPLHTGQKGPLPMVGGTPISHQNGVQSQKLMLLLLLLSKIIIVETFVKITIPESRVWVPENSNVNLTCLFVDDQGAGRDRVRAQWKWITKDQIPDKGVETVWDEKQQKGRITLQISNITKARTGKYACVVWIKGTYDYGFVNLDILNISQTESENKVQVNLPNGKVDMWDGPPLRIKCTHRFKTGCQKQIRMKWWKWNTTQEMWNPQVQGTSWWTLGNESRGWLNITNSEIGRSEGKYLCVIICGNSGGYGVRKVEVVLQQERGIKPEQEIYNAKEGQDLVLRCRIPTESYTEYEWWFGGQSLVAQGKYQIKRKPQEIVLVIKEVLEQQDNGQYWCWVARDDWWAAGMISVYVERTRVTRQVLEDEIQTKPENLIVGLIRDFGQTQNVSAITACLPLPHAAGDPIPWGIIPAPDMPVSNRTVTLSCTQEIRSRTKLVNRTNVIRRKTPRTRADCYKLPNAVFTRIGRFQGVGWCEYDERQTREVPATEQYFEITCQNVTNTTTMEQWQTIWGPIALIVYKCLLGMIVKEGQHTRRIMKAIMRREVLAEPAVPPPAYRETAT